MSVPSSPAPSFGPRVAPAGFVAGFLAVLPAHQPVLALLAKAGIASGTACAMRPAALTGVPQVLSSAYWGGVSGVAFAAMLPRLGSTPRRLVAGPLLGALLPSSAAWFVDQPLRGLPPGNGWKPQAVATARLVNGAWGLGTALLLPLVPGGRRRRDAVDRDARSG